MLPITPNAVKTSSGSPSKKGKKRPRPHDDDDDEYNENRTPRPAKRRATRSNTTPAVEEYTKVSSSPIEPLPLSNVVQIQRSIDLANLAPQPLRISYKPHPLEDRSDTWYTEMFRRLFRQSDRFAKHYFGVHDLKAGQFFEPWAASMTDEFITWAEQVAEPDANNTESWDELLRDTPQRKWLVMGVLMKIIKVKVFDVDMFGASKEQGELMHGISRALIGREGFGRQALRAETARTIMGRNSVTESFYPEVATLTAQISLLLKPLTDYLYGMQPRLGVPLPNIEDQYQALHNLVSTAAYLSLCIKLSPTIFTLNDVFPGTPYDDKDIYSLEPKIYQESKTAVHADYRMRFSIWDTRRKALEATLDALEKAGKRETRAGDKAAVDHAKHLQGPPIYSDRDYRPMCKIGVWPVITRYKPGGDEDDEKGECSRYVKEKDGFRILQMAKGAVVVYLGWVGKDASGRGEPDPAGERVRLRTWVQQKIAEAKGKRLDGKTRVVAGLGVAVAGVMMVGGYGMLAESYSIMQGMDYIEVGRFLTCEVFKICHV
ncbi:hypothetical protein N431DRAFT_347167 [Stipitochalara longipes BDJ]|nr:hypothetical protein N431DRAFT_347167 [Stipitochalara longipes BDJ]